MSQIQFSESVWVPRTKQERDTIARMLDTQSGNILAYNNMWLRVALFDAGKPPGSVQRPADLGLTVFNNYGYLERVPEGMTLTRLRGGQGPDSLLGAAALVDAPKAAIGLGLVAVGVGAFLLFGRRR